MEYIGLGVFAVIMVAGIIFIAKFGSKNDPAEKVSNLVRPEADIKKPNAQQKSSMTMEQARKERAGYELKLQEEHLKDLIKDSIARLSEDRTPELRKANEFVRGKMEELLAIPVENESDLEYLAWRYNGGELRTEDEIASCDYVRTGKFDSECAQTNAFVIVLFVLIGFLIPFVAFIKEGDVGVGFVLGVFLAMFFGLIGAIISHSTNLAVAKQNRIPDDNPRVQHERRRRNEAILGTVASAAAIGHHTKKTVKDIANVDSWKEMK